MQNYGYTLSMSSQEQNAQFSEEFSRLPSELKREVIDFMEFLLKKSDRQQRRQAASDPETRENPLWEFVGGVEHGSLAEGIDETLYG